MSSGRSTVSKKFIIVWAGSDQGVESHLNYLTAGRGGQTPGVPEHLAQVARDEVGQGEDRAGRLPDLSDLGEVGQQLINTGVGGGGDLWD